MGDCEYYRGEAQRCRDLVAATPESRLARRWHELADEYITLAEELDAARTGRASMLRANAQRTPMQQQPVQQQQEKIDPDHNH